MATKYLAKFASVAAFLAASPDRGNASGIGVVSDKLYMNVGGEAVNIAPGPAEVLTALATLTAEDNGKTLFLNSATEFAVTLPAAALGFKLKFVVAAAPSGASYTIVTPGSAQIIFGKQHSAAGDAGDVENTGGATTITFVDGQAVVGDVVTLESDGTNWYALLFTSVAAGGTFTG